MAASAFTPHKYHTRRVSCASARYFAHAENCLAQFCVCVCLCVCLMVFCTIPVVVKYNLAMSITMKWLYGR